MSDKKVCYLINSLKDAYGAINLYNLVLSLNVKKTPWLLSLFILAPTKFISILEQYNHIKPFEIIQIQIFTSQKLNSLFNILQFKKYYDSQTCNNIIHFHYIYYFKAVKIRKYKVIKTMDFVLFCIFIILSNT